MIVILIGVSGVGKTTIGALLAARTGWKFEDTDDYHSEENRKKMASGIPLTDADRGPCLNALHERMLQTNRISLFTKTLASTSRYCHFSAEQVRLREAGLLTTAAEKS